MANKIYQDLILFFEKSNKWSLDRCKNSKEKKEKSISVFQFRILWKPYTNIELPYLLEFSLSNIIYIFYSNIHIL